MERYLYIRDNESNHLFPENKPYHFKIQLKYPLKFDGFWKVALCEVYTTRDLKSRTKSTNTSTLYLFSNVCKESIVNGEEYAVLRRFENSTKNKWIYIFNTPFYLPLKKTDIQELEFIIKTADGELASFIDSPVHITLHFKRYPFYPNYESI